MLTAVTKNNELVAEINDFLLHARFFASPEDFWVKRIAFAAKKLMGVNAGEGLGMARTKDGREISDWYARIQNAVKSRVVLPPNIEGNPEARFEVVLLPGGEVLSATLKKSSGNPAYDTAVERAINRASPLPVPSDTDMFQGSFKELTLVFRPKD